MGVWWVERSGPAMVEQTADGRRVVVVAAPHSTLLDSMAVVCAGIATSPVAMDWLTKVPLVGTMARMFQAVFVERGSKQQAPAPTTTQPGEAPAPEPLSPSSRPGGVVAQLKARVQSEDRYFPPLVFPEGTTHNGRCLIEFKSGAFAPMAPVQPVLLRFPCCSYTPAWCGAASLGCTLWRTMSQVFNRAHVQALPVMEPQEGEDAKGYAARVRNAMAAAGSLPLVPTDHSLAYPYADAHGSESPVWACRLCALQPGLRGAQVHPESGSP